jgi:hypothetical protein
MEHALCSRLSNIVGVDRRIMGPSRRPHLCLTFCAWFDRVELDCLVVGQYRINQIQITPPVFGICLGWMPRGCLCLTVLGAKVPVNWLAGILSADSSARTLVGTNVRNPKEL